MDGGAAELPATFASTLVIFEQHLGVAAARLSRGCHVANVNPRFSIHATIV
jgi:hypothetical protein